MQATISLMPQTEEQIKRIAELGRDPKNWRPAGHESPKGTKGSAMTQVCPTRTVCMSTVNICRPVLAVTELVG